MTMARAAWNRLPMEMKMAIVDAVSDPLDVKALSNVDHTTHNSALHALYKNIRFSSFSAMQSFLINVPLTSHGRFVRHLEINTSASPGKEPDVDTVTEAVAAMLRACKHIRTLSIRMEGSLNVSILPLFQQLAHLRELTLSNSADEDSLPLSERLVVWIAASVPHLEALTLERVSRSTMHAPELIGVYPYTPLVSGDDDVPDHPYLGPDLYLPNLLRIPTLRHLAIRDTHLGDLRWSSESFSSPLRTLEIGTCFHESEESNGLWTERLLKSAGGCHLEELTISSGVTLTTDYFNYDQGSDAPPAPAFPLLRKLRFALAFPADLVVDTLSNLAGSPVETLEVQCYEEDVEDMCEALNEFLALRVELMASSEAEGEDWFCHKLQKIDVAVVASPASGDLSIMPETASSPVEWDSEVMGGLQEFCEDLEIESTFQNGVGLKCMRSSPVCWK